MKQRVHPKTGERRENIGTANGSMQFYIIPIVDTKRLKVIEHFRPIK